jgi:hypothetical protein
MAQLVVAEWVSWKNFVFTLLANVVVVKVSDYRLPFLISEHADFSLACVLHPRM